jgi:DNA-binding NarL/FixJ family response regulator
MKIIKLAVVDDHDLFREGIKLVLGQIEGVDVLFDTPDGARFIELLEIVQVDMVLMDIEMPGMNGIMATTKALQIKPDLKVIALTMFTDIGHYTQMINAGARGFVLKKAGKHELAEAITTVYQGGDYLCREIMNKLNFQNTGTVFTNSRLTGREMEIMLLICKGLTTQEISDTLCISFKTVETHRGNIYVKSCVKNTAGLILWAIKNHYFSIE